MSLVEMPVRNLTSESRAATTRRSHAVREPHQPSSRRRVDGVQVTIQPVGGTRGDNLICAL